MLDALRRLLFTAACAGGIAGIFAAVAHQIATVPLIAAAERYEHGETAVSSGPEHEHGAQAGHAHAPASWEPAPGFERGLYTLLADLVTAVGFALLLVGAIGRQGTEPTWREGMYWGLGGFAAFALAPGLGLPPELPGTQHAPLFARQLWWWGTVVSTATGAHLLFLSKRAAAPPFGIALLVLPHAIGAPQPAHPGGLAPETLARQFAVSVTVVSLLFWVLLGVCSAELYRFFAAESDIEPEFRRDRSGSARPEFHRPPRKALK